MTKILSLGFLFGAVLSAWAGSTTIYFEDWGTTNGGTAIRTTGTLPDVGWTGVAVSQVNSPYLGIFLGTGAKDFASGALLPPNTAYFTHILPNQTSPGMFYTANGAGTGGGGDSAFTTIDPTLYTNLSIDLEIWDNNSGDTNYFAVQVGGVWYVATSFQLPYNTSLSYPDYTNVTLLYTNPANVWQNLTVNSTSVTIGAVATPSLTTPITGIGIVELPTANGPDYNELTITAFSPSAGPPPTPASISAPAVTPQSSFVGGGASFLINAAGTQPLTYIWETNGVPIGTDPRFLGLDSGELTITNLNLSDAAWAYSIIVTNAGGSATNSGLVLNVATVPPDLLYAEDFPFVGPSTLMNIPITGVGWVSSASASTGIGIFQATGTGGQGDVFSYAPSATTNVYYTTDTNDIGLSGLSFNDITPGNYPAVTFQAGFAPGNGAGQGTNAVSVYWAVSMNGVWYCSSQRQPIVLSSINSYLNYQYAFNPAVTNWNNLTITGTGGVIGSQASSPLTGNITGAGIVVAHNDGTGSDMNFQNFEVITDSFVGIAPLIGTNFPYSVGVSSGGGASFSVSTIQGSAPFAYFWLTNGIPVGDGGKVSGSSTPTLTISDLTSDYNGLQITATVSNSAGTDTSGNEFPAAVLTVTNAPIGYIYYEGFPYVGPPGVDYPISDVGWVEAVPNAPNALFQATPNTSQGTVFAYLGSAGATVYYTTTATDTNQAGLPFPNINLAGYPQGLNISVDLAPQSSSSNVTAYLAVQLNNSSWYVAASPLPVPTSSDSSTFATYSTTLNLAAANWKNLTVTASGGLVGSTATSNLKGVMTGAGLVFVTTGTGGTFNFQNFVITGNGPGGINVGALSNGNLNLSWVGNPVVELQSTTNLTSNLWHDMPATYGLYSYPVPATARQTFFRLGP